MPQAIIQKNDVPTTFVIGTYRLHGEVLTDATSQAMYALSQRGLPLLIDSAGKYEHGESLAAVLRQFKEAKIGWKCRLKCVAKDVDEGFELYRDRIFRVLLHNYKGRKHYSEFQQLVETKFGKSMPIGVCNISADQLQALVDSKMRVNVVQNELHPFLTTKVPELCSKLNIIFEAHSTLTKHEELAEFKLSQSTPSLAIAYASARSTNVCFTTTNYVHLNEILNSKELLLSEFTTLSNASTFGKNMAKYKGAETQRNVDWIVRQDVNEIRDVILPQFLLDKKAFEEGKLPSFLCESIPKPYASNTNGNAHKILAELVFPGEETHPGRASQLLLNLCRRMRRKLSEVRAEEKKTPKLATCAIKAVTNPDALPVDYYPSADHFDDFNKQVEATIKPPLTNLRFEYGTICEDGRLDLCKQGIKNAFVQSCQSVHSALGIKHYLFGNNRILENDINNENLDALVKMIMKRPDIVTWFLAGNGLDAKSVQPVSEALAATQAKYVWLKMNPIKDGAYHVGKMIRSNKHCELIDLFNTGLEDSGLAEFVKGLDCKEGVPHLKHVYFAINMLSEACIPSLTRLLELAPNLESLFISVNPIGDEGMKILAPKLKAMTSLKRLNLGATKLTDESLPLLLDLVETLPNLQSLDLGSYKSTDYFHQKHNVFTDVNTLLKIASHVKFFGLQFSYPCGNDKISELTESLTKLNINYNMLQKRDNGIVTRGQVFRTSSTAEQDLKDLRQPLAVEFIKSIYRNTMKV